MNIIGVLETAKYVAAINTSATGTVDHNFSSSSIWAHPVLQRVSDIDSEDGRAETYISKYTDAGGTHNVHYIGIFADNCTRVQYALYVKDCAARALCTTHFLA